MIGANPFDDLAPYYDSWFATPVGAGAGSLERDLLLRLALPQPGERALEVGAGTGHFARIVAEAGAQVVGVDLSRAMLRIAAGKALAPLLQADARALPLLGEQFDLVYSVTLLEFVPEPSAALGEMWAAVRPGGRLVAAVLNRWSPWAARREPPLDRAHLFSAPELVRLLGRYGPVRWGSAVFFMPGGRLLRQAELLERVGRRWLRPFGALLVARVDRHE